MRLLKKREPILTIDDWRRLAPPKRDYQWKPGRSAFELARAWCHTGAPVVPADVVAALASSDATAGLQIDTGFPEHRIAFDQHGGEPRNADLAFTGIADGRRVAVTIEAKADEPFGETVGDTVSASLKRLDANPNSRGLLRVVDLCRCLFSARVEGQPSIESLRYQLLTAAAGSLAFAHAEAASVAVLLVHEFVTHQTTNSLHERNGDDLHRFLCRLGGSTAGPIASGQLVGPFQVPGLPLFERPTPLYVGKVSTDCRLGGH